MRTSQSEKKMTEYHQNKNNIYLRLLKPKRKHTKV